VGKFEGLVGFHQLLKVHASIVWAKTSGLLKFYSVNGYYSTKDIDNENEGSYQKKKKIKLNLKFE
jgi:hypothetical protein